VTQSFQTLGLRPELLQSLAEVGYEEPTPIQVQTIPLLLAGQDVLGQAQTGTGKTAAFSLPMLNILDPQDNSGVLALVLTPTRELTNQVAEAIFAYGQYRGFRVLPIVGGQSYSRQINRLQKGVHVVVGTPGRVLDLINQKALILSRVQYLVLDEADTMLDMGFIEDVETIMSKTPTTRQTALFSATLDKRIQDLSKKYMKNPTLVAIAAETRTVEQTEQRHYLLRESSKLAALTRLLEVETVNSAVIFTRTKVRSAL
jgi:ATP-dependent RNA helicase DeaD